MALLVIGILVADDSANAHHPRPEVTQKIEGATDLHEAVDALREAEEEQGRTS